MTQLRKHLPHWLEAGFWISKVHKSQVGKVAALTALSVSSARDAALKSKILTGSDSYRSQETGISLVCGSILVTPTPDRPSHDESSVLTWRT